MKKFLDRKTATKALIVVAIILGISTIILVAKTASASSQIEQADNKTTSAKQDLVNAKQSLVKAQADQKATKEAAAKAKSAQLASASTPSDQVAWDRLAMGDCTVVAGNWANGAGESFTVNDNCTISNDNQNSSMNGTVPPSPSGGYGSNGIYEFGNVTVYTVGVEIDQCWSDTSFFSNSNPCQTDTSKIRLWTTDDNGSSSDAFYRR